MIVGLFLAAGLAAGELAPFTFREHRAGGRYNLQSLIDAGCEAAGDAIVCTNETAVAGTWAAISYTIVDLRLSRFVISGDRAALPDVVSALTAKYGEPCDRGSELLTNGLGNQFSSGTTTWCFKTGRMVLHDRYNSMNYYRAIYQDDFVRSAPKRIQPDF